MSKADLIKMLREDLARERREREVHRRHAEALQTLYAGVQAALDRIDGGVIEGSPCSTPAERIARIGDHALGDDHAVRRYVTAAVEQARDMGVEMQPGIALLAQVHGQTIAVALSATEIVAADLANSVHRMAYMQLKTLIDGMIDHAADDIAAAAAKGSG